MEAPGNNQVPIQCRSGCGFYGTSATEGMCSKCYKDYLKKRQAPPSGPSGPSFRGEPMSSPSCIDTASPTVPVIIPAPLKESAGADPKIKSDAPAGGPLAAAVATTEDAAAAAAADACVSQEDGGPNCASTSNEAQACTDDSPDKKKKNRCVVCRKKLGLTGFGCRCGGLFCAMHRYSDKHECSFDYRTHGAEEIRKNNPVIKGEKVKQI